MAFDVEVTLDEFINDILPYLHLNPDLEKFVGNVQVLFPCDVPEKAGLGWFCKEVSKRNYALYFL